MDEVIEATLLAANSDPAGEVPNVGAGGRISINELIKKIEKITRKKAKLEHVEGQKGDVKNTLADMNMRNNDMKAARKQYWKVFMLNPFSIRNKGEYGIIISW